MNTDIYLLTMGKKLIIFIFFLTLFSLIVRVYRIDEPNHYYFDEVYHAVTAEADSQNNPAAYDPFAQSPKPNTAYDWLHPPLAKLIQAGSIKILGDRPIAWRLPSAIIGTLVIPATFLLAYLIFGPTVAVFSSLVIAFENLNLVMSRITMNDIYVTFFILVSFILTVLYTKTDKKKFLIWTAIILGFAVSSKWTGAYAILAIFGYVFLYQLRKRAVSAWIISLLILPAIIYLASYSQFWLQGHSISQFVDLNKQIWWYQNRADLEHGYGTTPLFCVPKGLNGPKTWCPWILDARGVYFSYEQYGSPRGEAGEKAGYIYALGNPVIFWLGIITISYLVGKYFEEKKRMDALILLGYFVFWVPWIFSPRIMFLYHYLPSLPFLAVSAGVFLADIYKTKFKLVSILILLTIIAAFIYLFPISTGLPIKPESIDRFMWLSTWR